MKKAIRFIVFMGVMATIGILTGLFSAKVYPLRKNTSQDIKNDAKNPLQSTTQTNSEAEKMPNPTRYKIDYLGSSCVENNSHGVNCHKVTIRFTDLKSNKTLSYRVVNSESFRSVDCPSPNDNAEVTCTIFSNDPTNAIEDIANTPAERDQENDSYSYEHNML